MGLVLLINAIKPSILGMGLQSHKTGLKSRLRKKIYP